MGVFSGTEKAFCPTHGEYEAKRVGIFERSIKTPCPACQNESAKRDEERKRRAEREKQNRIIELMFTRSGIPPRFKGRTLETYRAEGPGQAKAKAAARAYVESWPAPYHNGTSLIFSGGPGTGKSHLACAIANAVIQNGYSALFTTVGDAMRSIKRAYDKSSGLSESDAIAALVEPALLVLDEIGADYGTEHSKALLFDVFNKRYENMRPTIVLTNLDAPALREYLGDRIIDRLREGGGKLIAFDWESHRK